MVSSNYIFTDNAVTTHRLWTPIVFFSTPKFERALEFWEGFSQNKVHCHASIGKWRWFPNAKNYLRFFFEITAPYWRLCKLKLKLTPSSWAGIGLSLAKGQLEIIEQLCKIGTAWTPSSVSRLVVILIEFSWTTFT